jgi:hypothetical protein
MEMRKSFSVAQKTGALTCVLSVLWICFIGIQAAWDQLGRAQDWLDGLVRMALPLLVSIPAILLFVLSCQLMRREATRDRIKNALGLLFGMGAFFFAFLLMLQIEVFSVGHGSPVGLVAALFVSVLVVLPTNAGVARYVMRASGIVPVKGEFVGQGSYMLLAFLLWAILSPVGIALSEDYQTDSLLDFGFAFLPFIIPYILYRLAVKYLVRDTIEEQVALDYPSKHGNTEGD